MDSELFQKFLPLAITVVLAVLIPAVFLILSSLLGPRSREKDKHSTYECGITFSVQPGDAQHRFAIKFYMVAVVFLVFDVEILFLFPLAIWSASQPLYGFLAMASFVGVLFAGWFYLVKRGALEWE